MNTEPTNCSLAREKLPLYVGGDLEPETIVAVREHLERCPACAEAALEAARGRGELVQSLRGWARDTEKPELWPSIREVLRAEGRLRSAPRGKTAPAVPAAGRMRAWVRWGAPLAAAAAIAAVLKISWDETDAPRSEQTPLVQAPSSDALPVVPVVSPGPGPGLRRVAPSEETLYLPSPYRAGSRVTPNGSPVSAAGYSESGGMR